LGSAAGYGTPGLPVDREATRTALGFAAVQEPVTAVQLSRGKGEAQLIFEIALLMQDLSRFAADVLLFSTREFGFLALAEEFTTGSSIMPQKRNLDVFELMRGRTATAQACLTEALGVAAKLPSGYHRDLQLIKFPLFRAIDLALETLAGAAGSRLIRRGDDQSAGNLGEPAPWVVQRRAPARRPAPHARGCDAGDGEHPRHPALRRRRRDAGDSGGGQPAEASDRRRRRRAARDPGIQQQPSRRAQERHRLAVPAFVR